jgi:hypothetical protein
MFLGWVICSHMHPKQASKRDDETRVLWRSVNASLQTATSKEQPRAFCTALEFLLDRVNTVRIDASNARLCVIAPVIKDHGVSYERGKLQVGLVIAPLPKPFILSIYVAGQAQ